MSDSIAKDVSSSVKVPLMLVANAVLSLCRRRSANQLTIVGNSTDLRRQRERTAFAGCWKGGGYQRKG
jgi:hypothetical protein